jgi:hypothetical protein
MSIPGIGKITAHQSTWNIVSSSTPYHTQWNTSQISVDTPVWACKKGEKIIKTNKLLCKYKVKINVSIPNNGTDITISGNEIRKRFNRQCNFKDDEGAEK